MRTAYVYNFLIEANIMASIAILLMIVLRKFLRRSLGNSCICFGWLLVAIRLLLPLSFANPVINTIRPPMMGDATIRPIAGQILVRTRDTLSGAVRLLERAGNRTGALKLDRFIDGFYFGTASLALFRVYLLGLALVVAWFIFSNVRFRVKIRTGRIEAISGKLLEDYLALCKERSVKPVPVYYTDPLPSACLLGFFRPYIALPLTASPTDVIYVLTHEICHLKNRDHLWAVLRLVCCALHWFNPLVWIAAAMSRTDRELRCDDRVVAPMSQEQKQLYANVLVLAASRRNAPGVAVLATGMTMTGKRLKERVLTVMSGAKAVRWLSISFIVVASMCLVGAFATSEPAGTNRVLSSSAMQHIDSDKTTVDCPHFVVKFRDSLYDGSNVILSYDVIPKDAGILLSDKEPTESWYALTHISQDSDALQAENKTILKQWDEGEYKVYYLVEADNVFDITENEDIKQYGDGAGGILNTETGTFTGEIVVPFDQYKAERSLSFTVRMLPFTDIHKENSENYDLAEYASIELALSTYQSTDDVDSPGKAISHTKEVYAMREINLGPSAEQLEWNASYLEDGGWYVVTANNPGESVPIIQFNTKLNGEIGAVHDWWFLKCLEHELKPEISNYVVTKEVQQSLAQEIIRFIQAVSPSDAQMIEQWDLSMMADVSVSGSTHHIACFSFYNAEDGLVGDVWTDLDDQNRIVTMELSSTGLG